MSDYIKFAIRFYMMACKENRKPNQSESGIEKTMPPRRGDEEIRRLLAQAAFVHVQHAPRSIVVIIRGRLKSKGKAHRKVQMACTRKLLTVTWFVIRKDCQYIMNPEDIERVARRRTRSRRRPRRNKGCGLGLRTSSREKGRTQFVRPSP